MNKPYLYLLFKPHTQKTGSAHPFSLAGAPSTRRRGTDYRPHTTWHVSMRMTRANQWRRHVPTN